MKKLCNLRVPVVCALGVILGGGCAFVAAYYRINTLITYSVVGALLAIICLLCALAFKRKKIRVAIFALVFFVLGTIFTTVRVQAYETKQIVEGGEYYITGIVEEVTQTTNGNFVVVGNVTADNDSLSGKIYAYIHDGSGDTVEVGNAIGFYAELESYDVFMYGAFNTKAVSNIKYQTSVFYGVKTHYRFQFFNYLSNAIQTTLNAHLSTEAASVATALLTGNTDFIESSTLQSFRYGGVAHVFAVSGLHIGILFGLCVWICRKCRAHRLVSPFVCVAVCLLYAGVCGFSPSSVRAIIMCGTFSFSRAFFQKYDGLNSLAFAAIVVLFINPFYLLSVGFQLSFLAVGSIYILAPTLKKCFRKLPNALSSAISTSLAVQVATFPVLLTSFGYVSWTGLFLNILFIPVFTVVFLVLFVATVLALILPFLAPYLLFAAGAPLDGILSLITSVGWENVLMRLGGVAYLTPLYLAIVGLLSQKINLSRKVRTAACSALVCVLAGLVAITAYAPLGCVQMRICAYYGDACILFSYRGQSIAVVSTDISSSAYQRAVNSHLFTAPQTVVILGDEEALSLSPTLWQGAKDVYLFGGLIPLYPDESVNTHYEYTFEKWGVTFTYVDEFSLSVQTGEVRVGITFDETNPFTDCNLLVAAQLEAAENAQTLVSFSNREVKYNIYEYGSLLFDLKNDKIKMRSIAF